MLRGITSRLLGRVTAPFRHKPTAESHHHHNHDNGHGIVCHGSRRGITRRPIGMVRLQNRRANKIARHSRALNRAR